MYVNQLPQDEQSDIRDRLINGLMAEGRNVFDIDEILQDAMVDKVSEVMAVLAAMEEGITQEEQDEIDLGNAGDHNYQY